MKSRGQRLHAAFVSVGCYSSGWTTLLVQEQNDFERAAAEYDRATRAELPEDAETFAQDLETRLAAHGPAVTYSIGADTIPRLIAIVREQATELRRLKDVPDGDSLYAGCLCGEISPSDKPCLTCVARLEQWDVIIAERNAICDRLAKLEAATRRHVAFFCNRRRLRLRRMRH